MLTTTPSAYDDGYTILEQVLKLKKIVDDASLEPLNPNANVKVRGAEIGNFKLNQRLTFINDQVAIGNWLSKYDGNHYEFQQTFYSNGAEFTSMILTSESILYEGIDGYWTTAWSIGTWHDDAFKTVDFKEPLTAKEIAFFAPVATVSDREEAGIKLDAAVLSSSILQRLLNAVNSVQLLAEVPAGEIPYWLGETWQDVIDRGEFDRFGGDMYVSDGVLYHQGHPLAGNGVIQTVDMPIINGIQYQQSYN